MKKSIISMAVAAGLMATGTVFAETTVYGHAQVEVGSWGSDKTGTTVEDAARGRIGFKSAEDVGEGMKALAKFEFKADTADGDSSGNVSLTKREMLVGLKTGMGTVELGRLKSAYKYFGGVKYDPYVASLLEARGNGGMTGKIGDGNAYGHNGFISNSIAYDYEMGAMSFRLTYDLEDAADGGDPSATPTNGGNGMTAGFKFDAGDFEIIAALADDDGDSTSTNGNTSTVKFGGQFNGKALGKISVQLESGDNESFGGKVEADIFYVDYQFSLDKNNIIDVAMGNEEQTSGGTTTDDIDFMRVAFTHKLSKETKVWVGYRSTEDNITNNNDISVVALGMQKKF